MFSKVSGPAWLVVAASGTLSGMPANSDAGTNSFVVRVTDGGGLSNNATMTIYVNGAPSFTSNPFSHPGVNAGQPYSGTIATNATDPNGDLLTVSDRGPSVYRIEFIADTNAADVVKLPDCFTPEQLAPFSAEKTGRYDCEGVAADELGRLYLCEEENRWILRWDPLSRRVERLKIDWSPVQKYFSPTDHNASFEGITIGGGRLYVANEREQGWIIVVDLRTLKVTDDFEVRPGVASFWGPHYSDLCWFRGELFVLMREDHVILRIDPRSHRVLAEYDFRAMEFAPENKYRLVLPFVGVMEGLAVDDRDFWLATDNNGLGRARYPRDTRPTLFRCPRPDRR